LFLRRTLRFVLAAGVRQVLDIGCGLPDTPGSVHQIAVAADPGCRIVYVDNDPIVVANARQVAAENSRVFAVQGDLRDVDPMLADPEVVGALDWSQPVTVVLAAVLHFITDSDGPAAILTRLRDSVPAGSYLIISHASVPPDITPEQVSVAREYSERTAQLTLRSRRQVAELLSLWGPTVEPGVAGVAFWRPDLGDLDDPAELERAARIPGWVGVACKRADSAGIPPGETAEPSPVPRPRNRPRAWAEHTTLGVNAPPSFVRPSGAARPAHPGEDLLRTTDIRTALPRRWVW
jgi:SAM-dependent methyltransferase